MGIVIRQSFWTSVISYIGVVLGYVNLLYLYPRFLDPDQIGLLRTITDAAILFAAFAQAGLSQTIARYFPQYSKDRDEGQKFINLIFVLSLGAFILFATVFFLLKNNITSFFGDNAGQLESYLILILWLTFIMMLITLTESFSRANLKVTTPNFLREIGLRVMQGVLVLFYFIGAYDFYSFLILTVLSYVLNLLILLVYLKSVGELKLNLSILKLPTKKFREMIQFSVFSLAGTGALLTIIKIDSLMITPLTSNGILSIGLSNNAIYTTAVYMATVIEIPRRAINQTTNTLIARAFEKGDLPAVETLYKKTTVNQLAIGALLFIGVWTNLESIFSIMPKGDFFIAGYSVVIIIGVVKLMDMLFGPNGELLVLSKYYWFHTSALMVMIVISITLNYLLIPEYGIEGAAYATVITYLIFNLVKFSFIYIKLKIQPFTVGCLKVLVISILVIVLNNWLPSLENSYLDILYRSAIISVLYGVLIISSRSSAEINTLFEKGLSMIKSIWK